MSKFATSDRGVPAPGTASVAWLLIQTFWVGGLWLLHALLVPAMAWIGLAPLLVEEFAGALGVLLVKVAALGAGLQCLLLVFVQRRLGGLWRDIRGRLLLGVLLLAAVYLAMARFWPGAGRWQLFDYLLLAACGLSLVLQPVPVRRR